VGSARALRPFNYREGKVLSMRELAEREQIDLSASHAYSDSESDLPMLRAVGHPVVVNPDAELRRIASSEGWEVLRLDRLGQRLKVLAALGAVAALGGLGRAARGGRSRPAPSALHRPLRKGSRSARRPARIG
jgi:hypothetical protein